MSFKNKNKKIINYDNKVTLESKHNDFIKNFKSEEYLNKKKQELKETQIKLEKIKESKHYELINEIKDHIIEIKDEINNYENNTDNINEIEYYLNNGNIIFDYYKNNDNNYEREYDKTKIEPTTTNPNNIMKYFGQNIKSENIINHKKQKLLNNYLLNTKNNYEINFNYFKHNLDFCNKCKINKIVYISEGKHICPKCGEESNILIESDKPSYKDPPREITYFSYKRINHFNEWLAQFQAKETTDIPKEIYEQILKEIKKERIDINNLKSNKLRAILKKIGKNKFYEHIPHILTKLNGKTPPIMSTKLEEELRRMFKEIQIPFHKFCPKNRKNFLSYSYVLHKFVELLCLNEYTECFILLKSREKLHQQDIIWKNICNYLGWEFISSI